MAVALLAWGLVPNVPLLLVVLAPLALAGGTLNTVLNSLLTKSVAADEVGGTLGLSFVWRHVLRSHDTHAASGDKVAQGSVQMNA